MKKRTLVLVVCIALALAMGLGGTLAYLTDTDADVNTMVLGNVQIVQNEQEWNADETALQQFTQDKPLLPYVGEMGWENKEEDGGAYRRFTMENVVDKYVTVTNTGKSDAYVRTIFALEMGSASYDQLGALIGISNNKDDGAEFDFPGTWVWTADYEATIGGKAYNIVVAEHKDPIAPGETTIPSLMQLYLKNTATNEDVTMLDGNGNGKYDVLVLSQAVQAQGFDDAHTALDEAFGSATDATKIDSWFSNLEIGSPGDKNDTNNPPLPETKWADNANTDWYSADATENEYTISTAAELSGFAKMVNEGNNFSGKTVKLTADIDLGEHMWTPIGNSGNNFSGTFDGGDHTIKNIYVENTAHAGLFGKANGPVIKNVKLSNVSLTTAHYAGAVVGQMISTDVENCSVSNLTIVCLPEAVGDGWDNGDKIGGIVGHAGDGHNYIVNCSVTNAEITGYRDVGGIVGYSHGEGSGDDITGCTISNVTLNQNNTNNYKNYATKEETDVKSIAGELVHATVADCTGEATINYIGW